jgi:hypothetical protein
LPDFSWCIIPEQEKYTKRPQNIPNGRKIIQTAIKYANVIHRNLPKLGFLI